jgi:hypothetical protein
MMRAIVFLLCVACTWPLNLTAGEIDLLLPENNVSSRPILEFRARKPTPGGEGRGASLVGHAYVLLGETRQRNTLFNNVRGFYPDGKGARQLINMAYGKGVVRQTLDMGDREAFTARLVLTDGTHRHLICRNCLKSIVGKSPSNFHRHSSNGHETQKPFASPVGKARYSPSRKLVYS